MKEKDFNITNDFDSLLNSLEMSKLTEEELIWVSSFGGDGSGVSNTVSGCGPTNNCHSGNCVPGCSGSGK